MDFSFKEWFIGEQPPPPAPSAIYKYSDLEVANLYFHNPSISVREISRQTDRSIGEVYRLLKQYGTPNRQRHPNHQHVISLADSGIPVRNIADMTGYSPRHVRNILKERLK